MSGTGLAALAAVTSAIVGAIIGWGGNYHIQHRIGRDLRRVEELRQAFHKYLDLCLTYWTDEEADESRRRVLEARLIVAERMISSEYSNLAKTRRAIKSSYDETQSCRMSLWDAATGGCFQQHEGWKPDLDRVKRVSLEVNNIVRTFA